MAFTFGDDKAATSYVNITDGKASINVLFTNLNKWYGNTWAGWEKYFDGLGVMVTLHPKNSSGVSPVQILKEYSVRYGNIERLGVDYH